MSQNHPGSKFIQPLFLSLLLLALWGCRLQKEYVEEWPDFQGNASRLGYAPDGPLPPMDLKWKYQTDGRVLFPPVLRNETVYMGSRDGNLYALKTADGSVLWQSKLGQGGIFQSPAVDDAVLITGQYALYYFIHAWHPKTGRKLWEYQTGELQNRPPYFALGPNQVCVNTDPVPGTDLFKIKSRMTCLNKSDGTVLWHHNLAGIPQSQPALTETHLLVATRDPDEVVALDLTSGEETWRYTLSGRSYTAPIIDRGKQRAYLATDTGFVYALELETGKLAWRYQYKDVSFRRSMALSENLLLLPDNKNTLYAFDTHNMESRWQYRAPRELSTPVATRDHIYAGCQNRMLYVLDRETGGFRWFFRAGDEILGSPILYKDQLIFGSSDGVLYTLQEREEENKPPRDWP